MEFFITLTFICSTNYQTIRMKVCNIEEHWADGSEWCSDLMFGRLCAFHSISMTSLNFSISGNGIYNLDCDFSHPSSPSYESYGLLFVGANRVGSEA